MSTAEKDPTKELPTLEAVNTNLSEWIAKVINVQKVLHEFVEDLEHPHFKGMLQWFSGLPANTMSLEVKPKETISLQRAVYRGNMHSLRSEGECNATNPFLGGAMLRADFHENKGEAGRYRDGIGVTFTAIQDDPVGGHNYVADSVIIPGVLLPEKVDISVVDTPAERIR